MSNIYPEDGAGPAGAGADAETPTTGAADVRGKLGEVKQSVKEEASQMAADAKTRAAETVAEKQQAVGGALQTFADAVRTASDQLGEREQTQASNLIRQAADGLEGLARNVSDKSPQEMLAAARTFGRSNPTALLIGSVVAGVALGRFFRSSSDAGTSAGADYAIDQTYESRTFADDTGDDAFAPEGEAAAWSSPPMDPIAEELDAATQENVVEAQGADERDETDTPTWSQERRDI